MSKRKQRSGGVAPRVAPAGPWAVRYHPTARAEADAVPAQERKAIDSAVDKLVSLGPNLPFPHSSKVMGEPGGSLRELRPRAGRSPWRCIYERIEDVFVIGAVGPEAQKDKGRFRQGCECREGPARRGRAMTLDDYYKFGIVGFRCEEL
jgi:hypothetical protein